MANLKSSKKNVRKSAKRRTKNVAVLRKIAKAKKSSQPLSSLTQKLIDKAVKEGVIRKNKGARLKSRLSKKATNRAKK